MSVECKIVLTPGYTCAHLAAAHGKCSTLKAVLKAGVDISTTDKRLWTVAHHAAFHGRLGVLQVTNKPKSIYESSTHDITTELLFNGFVLYMEIIGTLHSIHQ